MKTKQLASLFAFLVPFILAFQVWAESPPFYEGLGDFTYPVTTKSEKAQRYFDQGIVLAFGFNHSEAARSFREASRLDPGFAMAYWGEALVLGPNINAGMEDSAVKPAYRAVQKALGLSSKVSGKENDLIKALAERYSPGPVPDRTAFDEAYADAMRVVAKKHPKDATVQALYAEALMNLHPWDFWTIEGEAHPWTAEIVATLEAALELDPAHPLTNHLYIHAIEASPEPVKALESARRLETLVPGIGHLVHMPAHIYIRTGNYDEAIRTNERALEADRSYLSHGMVDNPYVHLYNPHNDHFILAAATIEGRSELAISSARRLASKVSEEVMKVVGSGTGQHFYAMPLYTLVKFGRWEEVLKEPRPPEKLRYPVGVWHYARGMAYARTGKLKEAEGELKKLKTLAMDPELREVRIWDLNSTATLLTIASEVLAGEMAASRGDYPRAVEALRRAIKIEDGLFYDEPHSWPSPVRETLGAVLMEDGRPEEAEEVFREDLRRYPGNGWALFGLQKCLAMQGKSDEARKAKADFERAWMRADTKLTSSRF